LQLIDYDQGEVIGHIVAMHLPRVASNEVAGRTRVSAPYIDVLIGDFV
jgi:hypothetical protein